MSLPPPAGRVYLVNVGVNAAHAGARSPLFPDGTFEFVPIPEDAAAAGPHSLRYCDLPCWHGRGTLADWAPPSWARRAAHADPDFAHRTYGDDCQRTVRARALLQVRPRDWVFFLARLTPLRAGVWGEQAAFGLIGVLEVAGVYHNIRSPSGFPSATLAKNAHFRRALNNPRLWDGFSVIQGSRRSGRFLRACLLDRPLASRVLRDARGRAYEWPRHRTPLQVIGSYTRTCRAILDAEVPKQRRRWDSFWTLVAPHCADLAGAPAR